MLVVKGSFTFPEYKFEEKFSPVRISSSSALTSASS